MHELPHWVLKSGAWGFWGSNVCSQLCQAYTAVAWEGLEGL